LSSHQVQRLLVVAAVIASKTNQDPFTIAA
jgi:hypothetical protein